MKLSTTILLFLTMALVTGVALAAGTPPPKKAPDLGATVAFFNSGAYLPGMIGLVTFLTESFKAILKTAGVSMKGTWWSLAIAAVLSALAGFLQLMAGKVPWWQALITFIASGGGSMLVHQIIEAIQKYKANKNKPKPTPPPAVIGMFMLLLLPLFMASCGSWKDIVAKTANVLHKSGKTVEKAWGTVAVDKQKDCVKKYPGAANLKKYDECFKPTRNALKIWHKVRASIDLVVAGALTALAFDKESGVWAKALRVACELYDMVKKSGPLFNWQPMDNTVMQMLGTVKGLACGGEK